MYRLRHATLYLLASIGLLFLVVTFTPVLRFWITWLTGPRWDTAAGDVLIVLGAESPNAGMIGHSTYWRSSYGVLAWKQARFATVIVSGDKEIAQGMAEYMTSQGVPPTTIAKESQSTNTHENVVNSMRLVLDKHARIAVLSSDYHMRRVYGCFRKMGLNPLCIPAPDAGKRFQSLAARWSLFGELCVETFKLARYRMLGYV